jgi:hypothetical protein
MHYDREHPLPSYVMMNLLQINNNLHLYTLLASAPSREFSKHGLPEKSILILYFVQRKY